MIRKTTNNGKKETASGTLYYKNPDRLIIRVDSPVRQIFLMEGQTIIIYYPGSNRAFRFLSKKAFFFSFSYIFLGFLKEDFGLEQAGFTLAEQQLLNQALVIRWNPPQSLDKEIGNAVIEIKNNNASALKLYNPAGKLIFHLSYSDFMLQETCSFPGKVVLFMDYNNEVKSEELIYSDFVINTKLPEEIENFSLPENTQIKELIW